LISPNDAGVAECFCTASVCQPISLGFLFWQVNMRLSKYFSLLSVWLFVLSSDFHFVLLPCVFFSGGKIFAFNSGYLQFIITRTKTKQGGWNVKVCTLLDWIIRINYLIIA